jgi:hypothetical protein
MDRSGIAGRLGIWGREKRGGEKKGRKKPLMEGQLLPAGTV